MRSLHIALLWLAAGPAAADPLPVFGRIDSTLVNHQPKLRLVNDSCYTWGPPTVTRDGTAIAVSQPVTPIAGCTQSIANSAQIDLMPLPIGEYRVVYTPVPVGFGPMPVSIFDFTVRTAGNTYVWAISPLEPTALEPVDVQVMVNICERIAGVRLVNNAFRVEMDHDDRLSGIQCDADSVQWVTLGAFPPGSYRVEVALIPQDGGAVKGGLDFVVRPTVRGALRPVPIPDLSGLWASVNEERATGMTILHTRLPAPDGSGLARGMIAIWYRYDADGHATWYWVEAVARTGIAHTGTVHAYSATNPTSPGWQRDIAARPVGTISISALDPERTARVVATLGDERLEFTMSRVRFQRLGWPTQ